MTVFIFKRRLTQTFSFLISTRAVCGSRGGRVTAAAAVVVGGGVIVDNESLHKRL